jgi:hypothetical protein
MIAKREISWGHRRRYQVTMHISTRIAGGRKGCSQRHIRPFSRPSPSSARPSSQVGAYREMELEAGTFKTVDLPARTPAGLPGG